MAILDDLGKSHNERTFLILNEHYLDEQILQALNDSIRQTLDGH